MAVKFTWDGRKAKLSTVRHAIRYYIEWCPGLYFSHSWHELPSELFESYRLIEIEVRGLYYFSCSYDPKDLELRLDQIHRMIGD